MMYAGRERETQMAAGSPEFKQIAPDELEIAYRNAWSLECMEAHGAGGRDVEYVGSQAGGPLDGERKNGTVIFDYYRDAEGGYWYQTRAWLPDRGIVSMDNYIFDRKRSRSRSRSGMWQRERGQAPRTPCYASGKKRPGKRKEIGARHGAHP